MSNLREELKANNENINWVPKHIKQGRFGEWLDGVKDWALSRERFWGTPLPVWQCGQCVNIKVIGSRNELKIFFPDLPADINLHKPFIDEVKFSCDKCDGMMTRDASVLDCWFDSGSMPFAQIHYPFENKDLVDEGKWYPADFICEAIDQTRGWFYTLLAISTLLTKQAPYKNVICLGLINDKKGKKMSKSKGNIVDPWEVMEKFGVDALRFYFYTMNQPGEPKNFDTRGVEEVLKKNWLILWNILSFYKIYVNTEGESKEHQDLDMNNLDIKDKWILLKQAELIKAVTEYLDKYDITTAARSIGEFINELSTWYVRRSRERFKNGGQDAYQAVETLGSVLLNLAKLLAPFAPFVAERLYLELINDCPVKHKEFKESVHLEQWPMVNQKTQEHLSVLEQMKKVRQIIEKALSLRAEAKMKVRQPLKSLTIIDKELDDQYIEIIKSEINVKAVILGGGEIALDTKLNQGLILEGALREIIRTVNSLRKQAKLTINDQIELYIDGEGDMTQQLLDKYEDDLKNGVLANTIVNKRKKLIHQKEVKVGNSTIWVGFSNP